MTPGSDPKNTFPSFRIDSHVHAFPEVVGDFFPDSKPWLKQAKTMLRFTVLSPLTRLAHSTQLLTRLLPEAARRPLDEMSSIVPMANLLIESTIDDLIERMDENQITASLLIAHPPFTPNNFVIAAAKEHPGRLFAVIKLSPSEPVTSRSLELAKSKGVVACKIHLAADGTKATNPFYREALKICEEVGLPVILHTGCFHSHLLFKDPERGEVSEFEPWFNEFKKLSFVLAHCNGSNPMDALVLAKKYPNLFVEVSWQPTEIIGEAVRTLGADRVMFGSDWPLLSDNMSVMAERMITGVEKGDFSKEEQETIFWKTAQKVFNLCL